MYRDYSPVPMKIRCAIFDALYIGRTMSEFVYLFKISFHVGARYLIKENRSSVMHMDSSGKFLNDKTKLNKDLLLTACVISLGKGHKT